MAIKKLINQIPEANKAQFASSLLDTNIQRMHLFSMYVIVVQIVLNIINIVKPSDSKSSDIMIYVALSMGTLLLGIVYCILYVLAKRMIIRNYHVRQFLVHSFIYEYIVIQMVFCTLNIISTGGVNSYIIAILIIGLFPILRPQQSVTTILAGFIYLWIALYVTRSFSGTWNSIIISDVWTNLIIITGLIICISVIIYNMYVTNFLKSQELQMANDGLEETVHIRTLELEQQTEAAQVASRSKSEFLARMSHEIRTPLNAIVGMTQIARKTQESPQMLKTLDEIDAASQHLLGILNDVLDMARIESGKLALVYEPFSLSEAMVEVDHMIRPKCIQKELTFTSDFGQLSGLQVIGDRLHLKQVLINLLGNAVKFTPEKGSVCLETRLTENDSTYAEIDFAVKDSGIGMDGEQQQKLFQAFEQADATIAVNYGGSGLGLSISQGIVEQMGGKIEMESVKGQGSVFHFSIRLEKAEPSAPKCCVQEPSVPQLRGKKLLVVEDVEINRLILQSLLEETGAEIEEAENGKVACEMITAAGENYYDLVLMDIRMPVMDGYEATRAIRSMGRPDVGKLPIIALSANAYKEDMEKSRLSGMDDHLSKPVETEAMFAILNDYLKS